MTVPLTIYDFKKKHVCTIRIHIWQKTPNMYVEYQNRYVSYMKKKLFIWIIYVLFFMALGKLFHTWTLYMNSFLYEVANHIWEVKLCHTCVFAIHIWRIETCITKMCHIWKKIIPYMKLIMHICPIYGIYECHPVSYMSYVRSYMKIKCFIYETWIIYGHLYEAYMVHIWFIFHGSLRSA